MCDWKTVLGEQNRANLEPPGCSNIRCAFDIVVFNVISGSFSRHIRKWPVTRKRMFIERNKLTLWIQGHWNNISWILLWLKCQYIVHIYFSPCLQTKPICPSNIKNRISHLSHIHVRQKSKVWSNLASSQAERPGPWASC